MPSAPQRSHQSSLPHHAAHRQHPLLGTHITLGSCGRACVGLRASAGSWCARTTPLSCLLVSAARAPAEAWAASAAVAQQGNQGIINLVPAAQQPLLTGATWGTKVLPSHIPPRHPTPHVCLHPAEATPDSPKSGSGSFSGTFSSCAQSGQRARQQIGQHSSRELPLSPTPSTWHRHNSAATSRARTAPQP